MQEAQIYQPRIELPCISTCVISESFLLKKKIGRLLYFTLDMRFRMVERSVMTITLSRIGE